MLIFICHYLYISANQGSGQQCCYDRSNNLIVGPQAGGTVDLYAPSHDQWKHFEHDVLPYIYCCRGLLSDCSAYYKYRPSDNGAGYYQYFNITPPGTYVSVQCAFVSL